MYISIFLNNLIIILFVFSPLKTFALIEVDITRGNLNPLPVAVSPLSIDDNSRWTLDGGPYLIDGDYEIPVGKQLVIDPGVTVYFTEGSRLTVKGHLIAEATKLNPITFTSSPDSLGGWDGIYFEDTLQNNKLIHVIQDNSDGGDQSIDVSKSKLHLEKVSWTRTSKTILELSNPQVDVFECDLIVQNI